MGRERALFCSHPHSVLVIVCNPTEILVIDQQVFWYPFFLCIDMYSYVSSGLITAFDS